MIGSLLTKAVPKTSIAVTTTNMMDLHLKRAIVATGETTTMMRMKKMKIRTIKTMMTVNKMTMIILIRRTLRKKFMITAKSIVGITNAMYRQAIKSSILLTIHHLVLEMALLQKYDAVAGTD